MYGAVVIVKSDEEWKPRSRRSKSNPAARIAASVSRVVSQPPERLRPEEPVEDALKRPEEHMPRSDVLPEAELSARP